MKSILAMLAVVVVAGTWGLTMAYAAAPNIILADFEGKDYGNWQVTGTAFGPGPAQGTLPRQGKVSGYLGHGLANSYYGGDKSLGTLTSPEFKIERRLISFLIGGGGWPGKTCMNLLVDGNAVRTATGPNTKSGGSEALSPSSWDVGELRGKMARIQVVDNATGGWGHINVDQIVLTDRKPPALLAGQQREIIVTHRYLNIPIRNGAPKRKVEVLVAGCLPLRLDIELADGEPDWWAWMDASAWRGKTVTLRVDVLPEDSAALRQINQTDELKGAEKLYRESLRPQFHFSSRRGWNNDPNGLVFYRGEYHLFYQHNPYGWSWGNMHWGHAVSRDLAHWEEIGDALAPDDLGPMFSGSAVVDWKNTSGLGRADEPPQVLIYTAAGHPTVQCIASSTDGRSYHKFPGNPIVKEITAGNRDPKVHWHESSRRWVMALYVGLPGREGEVDKNGKPIPKHTIHFLTSPNLKEWTVASQIEGFHECPDFFELPVDGDARHTKWVLTAASSDYVLGSFDGAKYTPQTAKLQGHRGVGFYAAQTFTDIPAADGRRIQIGWLRAPSPGMPFNQAMSLPLELKLRATSEGLRLSWLPVKELEVLRDGPNQADALAALRSELIELRAEFEPADLTFTLRGATIRYDATKQEIVVNDHRAPAPSVDGRQRLIVYVDRTALEVFASDGLTYVPMPFIPKAEDRSVSLDFPHRGTRMKSLQVYKLKSIWK